MSTNRTLFALSITCIFVSCHALNREVGSEPPVSQAGSPPSVFSAGLGGAEGEDQGKSPTQFSPESLAMTVGSSPRYLDEYIFFGVGLADGPKSVFIQIKEGMPPTDQPFVSSRSFSFDFEVAGIESVGTDKLYVYGRDEAAGEDVIVRLDLRTPLGGRLASHVESTVPIGQPVPSEPDFTSAIVGDTWIEPSQRRRPQAPSRTTILRQDLGGIQNVVPDPHGRFLIVHSVADDLLQVTNKARGAVTLLENSGSIPALGKVDYLSAVWHPDFGRAYFGRGMAYDSDKLLVIDYNNDGVLDNSVEITDAQYQLLGFDAFFDYEGSFLDRTPFE